PGNNNTAPLLNPISNNQDFLDVTRNGYVSRPVYSEFSVCYGHTCQHIARLAIAENEWAKVRALFSPPAVSAEGEREQIRSAIALLETMTGKMTGTLYDKGENFTGMGEVGQMDCVDEATNTSSYLT